MFFSQKSTSKQDYLESNYLSKNHFILPTPMGEPHSANMNLVANNPFLSENYLRKRQMALLSLKENSVVLAVTQEHDYGFLESLKANLPHDYEVTIEVRSLQDIQTLWQEQKSQSAKRVDQQRLITFQEADEIIDAAIIDRASDVHIFDTDGQIIVRFRIDGNIIQKGRISTEDWSRVVVRLKVLANLDIAECRRPQSGSFQFQHPANFQDIRVSFHPTIWGEKVSLRLFLLQRDDLSFDALGLSSQCQELLMPCLKMTSGLVLMVGPTGSGKTTTMYAMLNELLRQGRMIATLEDPVEMKIAGLQQSSINEKLGFDYAAGIRSLLRQDPDVIFVGEIRDEETAQMCFRAAMTGHLVISSLHASCTTTALVRLYDLGVSPSDIYQNIRVIASQRLVTKQSPRSHVSAGKFAERHLGRIPIEEVMRPKQEFVSYEILESKTKFLEYMRDHIMLSFEESLHAKIFLGEIAAETAQKRMAG